MDSLRSALTSGRHAAVTQAISGLGGVGKTQLDTEYAYRYTSDYEVVWWVRSEEAATLLSDYAALAGALDLPGKGEADLRIVAEAVRRRLEQSGRWLLVFDNAVEASQVREYLPQVTTGHVVITSRNPAWGGIASPLPVHVFDRDESVEFLLRRTGQSDEAAAGELAEAVGDLPLALEQAAAYVEAAGQSLSGYVELFRERRDELLASGEAPEGYGFIVATTWNISFQMLEEESGEAAALLRLVSFLAPDDSDSVPEPLRAALAAPLAFDRALGALRRYSLVEVEGEELAVHRLVQAAVRDRLDEGETKEWAEAAVALLYAAYPYEENNVETWAGSGRLLAHALAAAGHSEPLGAAPEATVLLLNEVGSYLDIRADFVEAASSYRRALAIGEDVFGPDDSRVAAIVNNLGYILRLQGDLAAARAHFERALRIDEAAYGPDHPDVATDVNNLGSVLREEGDPAGARAHFERALRIDEAAYGPDHPKVAIRVNNLGDVQREQGDLAGARIYHERALWIDEAAYGPDHPEVATDVNNLGRVLRAEGDLAGARAHFERALKIFEKAFGPEHPNVATSVNNLGSVLQEEGDLAGARASFERAVRIDEAAHGPDHPDVAIDVNNLGGLLQAEGDLAGARAHFERALRIFRKFLGDDHPNTRLVEKNLLALGR